MHRDGKRWDIGNPPDHSQDDAYDRELLELLNEVRVAMPGVQVLFGFLLAVPFQQRFGQTTSFQRDVYLLALVSSALATAFLVAPTAYHRIMFRRRDKPALVVAGSHSLIAGLALLAFAMTCAVLLVCDVLFAPGTTVVATVLVGAAFIILWFAVGLVRRMSGKSSRRRGTRR